MESVASCSTTPSKPLAEAFGTYCLVLFGCGAVAVDAQTGGALGHLGVCLAFGLIVMVGIYAVGNVSGAHFNPAVTLGFCMAKRFPWREAPGYILAQIAGASAASLTHRFLFAFDPVHLGVTEVTDHLSTAQGFGIEVLLTFLLMAVILNVSTGHMEKGIMAGVAVGGLIVVEALVGGPLTGASMNPARSLGPALAANEWSHLWLYLTAPPLGALLAAPTCGWIQGPTCCDAPTE